MQAVGGFRKELNFGEDTVAAARLLQSGWRIAYVADALAYHSHAYSCREEYRRYFQIGQLHGTEPWLLQDFGKASGEGQKFVLSELQYLSRHSPWRIPEAILRSCLKYSGYKRGLRYALRKGTRRRVSG